MLVKKSDLLPLFDERIMVESSHSIEWVMELYYLGYQFDVLSHGWFIDVSPSLYSIDWLLMFRNLGAEYTSPSRLKRSIGVSPRLIDMIRFSIPKKYKNAKYLPLCAEKTKCKCLLKGITGNHLQMEMFLLE